MPNFGLIVFLSILAVIIAIINIIVIVGREHWLDIIFISDLGLGSADPNETKEMSREDQHNKVIECSYKFKRFSKKCNILDLILICLILILCMM